MNVRAESPPSVRVFVPTCRRPQLLPRALRSLLAQTHTSWICEVHNDDPTDSSPGELVRQLGDPRIRLVTHERNLGAVATFNLFYRATPEPYYALLEDDNWWDPRFLTAMIAALVGFPTAVVAWCNQRIWIENPDGSWKDAERTVNPPERLPVPRQVRWGDARQALGTLHANGAMLVRSRPGEMFTTPADIAFSSMESFRERMLPHPLVYVPESLAYFAITRASARTPDYRPWAVHQTAMLATFIEHAQLDDVGLQNLFDHYRAQRPPATNVFIHAALACETCRPLLRIVRPAEWARYLRGALRRPAVAWRAIRARAHHPAWWDDLARHTAARFAEERGTQPPE